MMGVKAQGSWLRCEEGESAIVFGLGPKRFRYGLSLIEGRVCGTRGRRGAAVEIDAVQMVLRRRP